MKVLKFLPEATAISTFFPMGVFMGYIMQYHFAGSINGNRNIQLILSTIQWWPWVTGSIAAIVTGIVLFGIKIKSRQYRYEHLYFLNIGMLLFFIAGISFMSTDIPYAPIYMCFIAHGICYIAALSYLNIRMGKTKFRFLRLSIPLVLYIFAVAVGATVVYRQINLLINNSPTAPINDLIGILLVISSISIIGCILTLEYKLFYGKLNYKSSLDDDINRENKNFAILEQKYFLITSKHGSVTSVGESTVTNKPINGVLFFWFVIMSKITSIMYFYWPFMFIHHIMSINSQNFDLFSINWFGFVGVIISTILLMPLTYKIQHFIGILLKLTYMILLLGIFWFDHWFTREITVIMWFLFLTLGFAFPNCDINILSYTNLKYTEIVLTIGYVVLNITVGVIQYITIRTPSKILNLSTPFKLVFDHALAFSCILIVLVVLGTIIMPNRDFKSLLELQNYINTYSMLNDNTSVVQMNERQPINTPNTTVNTTIPVVPVYEQPESTQLNNQIPSQQNNQQPYTLRAVIQQPPAYNSTLPGAEQPPPPYISNPVAMHTPHTLVVAPGGSSNDHKIH